MSKIRLILICISFDNKIYGSTDSVVYITKCNTTKIVELNLIVAVVFFSIQHSTHGELPILWYEVKLLIVPNIEHNFWSIFHIQLDDMAISVLVTEGTIFSTWYSTLHHTNIFAYIIIYVLFLVFNNFNLKVSLELCSIHLRWAYSILGWFMKN